MQDNLMVDTESHLISDGESMNSEDSFVSCVLPHLSPPGGFTPGDVQDFTSFIHSGRSRLSGGLHLPLWWNRSIISEHYTHTQTFIVVVQRDLVMLEPVKNLNKSTSVV